MLENGYIESYDHGMAKKYNYHHAFIMSSKDKKEINYDSILRFVKLEKEDFYTLEGEPSLEPHTIGKKQIKVFAKHCIENGVDPNTRVKIKDHKLGTLYENRFIGSLKDFYKIENINK
ncbi:hypothetical protein D2A34_24620 [Clostridium chromiireducens]|uniref:Uncharacterized protein n=2 Tax=Clostridium chromiireducens TaxID=225345 RepID=A0A399IGS4_9CLOT|nr:hypothetical protein [Clostridium chromiireducens]RII32108.1 hypothetical protein D2A34_24620 [Clostridium chromiireducens]